jgi:hypothetical protein
MDYSEEIEKSEFIIAEALNLRNPALFVLRGKGYKLGAHDSSNEHFNQITWYAIKDKRMFCAYEPIVLLGIVAMWETLGDAWQEIPNVKIKDELLDEIFSDD